MTTRLQLRTTGRPQMVLIHPHRPGLCLLVVLPRWCRLDSPVSLLDRESPGFPGRFTWAGLGYLAGEHIVAIYSAIERYKWYALAAAAVIAAALITHRIHARRRDTARKTN